MLLKLIGLLSLLFLLFHLPQAQSSRPRYVTPNRRHAHTHGLHHHASSSSHSSPLTSPQLHGRPDPQIEMVTESIEKQSRNAEVVLAAMVTVPHHHELPDKLGGMLDSPVSGPNPGGNSENLAASTGKNLLGDIAMVAVSLQHQVPEIGGMPDTPVTMPCPGGHHESFASSSGQNLLGDLLHTPVMGRPNPGGNSESPLVPGPNLEGCLNTITGMLDTPVSGPSPSGNSNTLGNILDTPVSGPNPGGNSQGLFASGPNSRRSSAKGLATSKLDNMFDASVSGHTPGRNSATLGDMLDTPVSGPNPGGNSQSLIAVSGPNPGGNSQILASSSVSNAGGNSEVLAASAGPNPGGNSESLVSSDGHTDQLSAFNAERIIGERDNNARLSAVSGPNPGGNSATLGSNLSKIPSPIGSLAEPSVREKAEAGILGSSMSEKTEADTLFDEKPRTPVPPSGPSPIHNSAVTNQGLFAVRNLRGSFIECEQEGERDSGRFHHFEANRRTINHSSNMGDDRIPSA